MTQDRSTLDIVDVLHEMSQVIRLLSRFITSEQYDQYQRFAAAKEQLHALQVYAAMLHEVDLHQGMSQMERFIAQMRHHLSSEGP
jgi:hypothetical protein